MLLSKDFIKRFLSFYFKNKPDGIYIIDDTIDECEIALVKKDNIETKTIKDDVSYFFEGKRYIIHYGATKIVFIFDNYNEVIKIPFNGEFHYDYNKTEEIQDIILTERDNCVKKENQIYEESPSIQKILLKNNFVFNFGGLEVYTQQKVSKLFGDIYSSGKESKQAWKNTNKKIRDRIYSIQIERTLKGNYKNFLPSKKFLADIIQFFEDGEEIVKNIDLQDMHVNNYGYLENNQPVIFDFSGFYSETASLLLF